MVELKTGKMKMTTFLKIKNFAILLACVAGAWMGSVAAAELKVLSAGAIEPGVKAAAAAFEKESGNKVSVIFNTAPQIRKRMADGEAFDVVLAPPAMLDELIQKNKVDGARASLGRVGMGVVVRADAPVPDIATAEAFRNSVVTAETLVFNRASTGLYLEELLRKQGLYAQIESRTTRYPDGASVMEHVLHGKGREIGFGAITEILLYRDKGLKLVGPLPEELQNYTSYSGSLLQGTPNAELSRKFVQFLDGASSKALFKAAGIEP
jgi:molybdate transport system substrate-binding protein